MKDKTFVREVIIGTLLLIIISLVLILTTKDIFKLPDWFYENLFLGVFTLVGAYLGASIAGANALKISMETWNKKEKETISLYYSAGFAFDTALEDIIYYIRQIIELRETCSEIPIEVDFTKRIKKNIENIKLLANEIIATERSSLHPVLSWSLVSLKTQVNSLFHNEYIVISNEEIIRFYTPITEEEKDIITDLVDVIDEINIIKRLVVVYNEKLLKELEL